MQKELLTRVSVLLAQSHRALDALRECQRKAAGMTGAKQAHYFHETVCPAMDVLRAPVDLLEMICDSTIWPMPTYGDLLFNV